MPFRIHDFYIRCRFYAAHSVGGSFEALASAFPLVKKCLFSLPTTLFPCLSLSLFSFHAPSTFLARYRLTIQVIIARFLLYKFLPTYYYSPRRHFLLKT